MVPTAAMSGALHKKQAQLITMHSWDFSDKGRESQRVGCLLDVTYPNILG